MLFVARETLTDTEGPLCRIQPPDLNVPSFPLPFQVRSRMSGGLHMPVAQGGLNLLLLKAHI